MNEFEISDYGIFNDAINTTTTIKDNLETNKTVITECQNNLKEESVFMGPICDSCIEEFSKIETEVSNLTQNFSKINSYLIETAETYNKGDKEAADTTSNLTTTSTTATSQTTNKKNINLTSLKAGSNVSNAVNRYGDELNKAEYATVSENLFTTTSTDYINGQKVEVTHIVINNGNQINGAPANGTYGNGLETSSKAANRLNSSILINGSHFDYANGTEDLKGANNIVIVNGEIKKDGISGGNELLLDSSGNIYNATGKSAQELVNNGVKYSFSCHSTQAIVNGDTSPSYLESSKYKRNVIGQAASGEYYIVTDTTYDNKLSDTAEYLKSKGCTNAYSLDQGGSVSLVRDNTIINNPSGEGENGERAVGDFLYFTA